MEIMWKILMKKSSKYEEKILSTHLNIRLKRSPGRLTGNTIIGKGGLIVLMKARIPETRG